MPGRTVSTTLPAECRQRPANRRPRIDRLVTLPPTPRLHALPWLLLVIGLALTYVVQGAVREAAQAERRDEFAFRANEIVDNIQRRMLRYEEVLEGAAGLFSASSTVDRGEFARYVQALHLERKYPGIQGVGFARLVRPAERAAHVTAVRAEGFPDYDIRPPGEREVYSSIVFLEPFDWRNQRAFGYDMFSEPVRRTAMALARDEGRTTISGKVRLQQETDRDVQAGVLMYLPVFRGLLPEPDADERRRQLVGWVYAPFRMDDLMAGILGSYFGEVRSRLDLRLYDGERSDAEALLFASGAGDVVADPDFSAVRRIDLFGHRWTVEVRALPTFLRGSGWSRANLIALAGSVCTLLLTLLVWQLVTMRTRALRLAEGMTEDLRRSEAHQRRLNRALRLLSDCNMALVHADEEYRLLAEVCRLCVERGGYLLAWVGYAEHDAAKRVRPVAHFGDTAGYLDHLDIGWADDARGRGPTGTAIRERRTQVSQDIGSQPQMAPWRAAALARGYRSSIALPLVGEGGVLGALMLYAPAPDAFDAEELRLLEEMASDLAFGVVTLRTRAEHAAAKEKMAFLAHFDPLTHLPNRVLLRDRFEQTALAAGEREASVALLYLDVDYFQKVNDALGHDTGDRLLVAIAERLRQCVPATDTVCRLSADEFLVLHPCPQGAGEAAALANAIRATFGEPFAIEPHQIGVTFSIGIALYPDDGRDFATLFKCADTAMHSAEEAGRNAYRFFTPEMNVDLREQMRLSGALLPALRRGEFVLHYQPQVDIASGRIVGAEALIRWQHPEDGLIPPGRFIPLAEQSGHIVDIGEWVLNEACRQARAWRDEGLPPLVVAVNLSALQFKRSRVDELVAEALALAGLPPACLELELTESILLQDVATTMQTLQALKATGVHLSIDDFGTGYSSLSYLKQLAVDKLKIDQSFVRDMLTDEDGASIVRAIIQLGHTLQLTVIAEGVETEAQLAFLGGSGCDEVQGYLLGRPLPADGFAELLRRPPARSR